MGALYSVEYWRGLPDSLRAGCGSSVDLAREPALRLFVYVRFVGKDDLARKAFIV
jgi:hypothetical protein